jgi:hypothetical protein
MSLVLACKHDAFTMGWQVVGGVVIKEKHVR